MLLFNRSPITVYFSLFISSPMSMIPLHRHSNHQINTFFTEHEFFTKCVDFNGSAHPFDDTLSEASYQIRLFANNPVIVNSSYRTPLCNKNSGGAPDSYHLLGKALDLNCGLALQSISEDIVSKGPLYRSLRQCGINGFGIAPSFLHIDTRTNGTRADPNYGSYSLWYY